MRLVRYVLNTNRVKFNPAFESCQAPGPDFKLGHDLDNPMVREAVRIGWRVESCVKGGNTSFGLDSLQNNSDKANLSFFGGGHWHRSRVCDCLGYLESLRYEGEQVCAFKDYVGRLSGKWVLVENLKDSSVAKLVSCAGSSRYFPGGRKKQKARIRKALGRWYNCPGLLISLTFNPALISRRDAWRECRRSYGSVFMERMNLWRKRHGLTKAKYISVIEAQPGSGYPHLHLVFPYLKYLAESSFMLEVWNQGPGSVDWKLKDGMSPVSYICKYVTKLEGWSDVALSYLWVNRTRLYTMSHDYVLPDYSDKRVAEWVFKRSMSSSSAKALLVGGLDGYDTVLGAKVLCDEIIYGGDT